MLRRWREQAPGPNSFAVVAAESASRLRDSESSLEGWQTTVEAATTLEAAVVLLRTPSSFSPSSTHRKALERFAHKQMQELTIPVAWQPAGLWEPATVARLCNELGLVYALNPLQIEDPLPPITRAYLRISSLGKYRNQMSPANLEEIADFAAELEKSWILFSGPSRMRDARQMQALLTDHVPLDRLTDESL